MYKIFKLCIQFNTFNKHTKNVSNSVNSIYIILYISCIHFFKEYAQFYIFKVHNFLDCTQF